MATAPSTDVGESANRPDSRDSFFIQVKILWIIGLWYPDKNDQYAWMYPFYSFAVLGLFYTSLLLSQIVYMIQVWGDIEEMVSVLFLMVTIVGEYVKMYPFICTPERVKGLVNDLTMEYFQAKSSTEEKIIRQNIHLVRRTWILFTLACAITCVIWGVYPFMDGSSSSRTLPLQAWVPFDTSKSPQYQLAYGLLVSGVCMSAIITSTVDSFISGLMVHAGVQLDLLAERLQNIKTELKADEHNHQLFKKDEQYFMDSIVYCVKHHMAIVIYVKDIENLFCFAAMSEFCSAGFVFVVTLFQLTLVSPFTFRFVTLGTYMLCIVFSLFLYCWYGNEIILKSMFVAEAAYMSDWHVCGHEKYRRIMLLLMIRTQRPLYVVAGKFIPLSIETYTTILRSSWSYFALLRQVHVEE